MQSTALVDNKITYAHNHLLEMRTKEDPNPWMALATKRSQYPDAKPYTKCKRKILMARDTYFDKSTQPKWVNQIATDIYNRS